jgi:hypothetical protein
MKPISPIEWYPMTDIITNWNQFCSDFGGNCNSTSYKGTGPYAGSFTYSFPISVGGDYLNAASKVFAQTVSSPWKVTVANLSTTDGGDTAYAAHGAYEDLSSDSTYNTGNGPQSTTFNPSVDIYNVPQGTRLVFDQAFLNASFPDQDTSGNATTPTTPLGFITGGTLNHNMPPCGGTSIPGGHSDSHCNYLSSAPGYNGSTWTTSSFNYEFDVYGLTTSGFPQCAAGNVPDYGNKDCQAGPDTLPVGNVGDSVTHDETPAKCDYGCSWHYYCAVTNNAFTNGTPTTQWIGAAQKVYGGGSAKYCSL